MGSRILTLQRQARELGRLRTGWSVPNADPKKRPRPVKSKTWVISSHAEHYVEAAAAAWGGKVERWQPQGSGAPQFRVITEAERIDALLPQGDPLSQHNEMWNKGGCMRRCDGQTEQISGRPCLCLAQFGEEWHQQPKGNVCAATSRLSVVLPDMPDVGVWRAETHSFYAANEWSGTIDLVLSGTGGKGMVPVSLRIEPRSRVAAGQTKHFPVVVVEIRGITPRQALTGPLSTALALDPAGGAPLAIEAGRPDYIAEAQGALTSDDVGDVYRRAFAAGHLNDGLIAELKGISDRLKSEETTAGEKTVAAGPDEDGAYEAELVEDVAEWPAVAQPGSGARS
ncbi:MULTISPECIES: recombination directionality factor [Streptomyces]|uniref:recombination directionality factor n=1 Tax=Streptomyces TaxID=1883 RepID=UPI00345C06B1